MKTWLLLAFAAPALSGCNHGVGEPKVTQAWVRLSAVPGRPAAGYFTLAGRSDNDSRDKLVRVESALADRIELHESMKGAGNMMSMKPLANVPIEPSVVVKFAPGGHHLMIFGLDPAVTPGTAIPLRFGFASGKTAEAEAKTVAAGEDAPY